MVRSCICISLHWCVVMHVVSCSCMSVAVCSGASLFLMMLIVIYVIVLRCVLLYMLIAKEFANIQNRKLRSI